MPPTRSRPRVVRLSILTGGLAVLVGSCTHLGEVHASYPRVFSSQRLVQQRLKETQWLERKLDEPVKHGFRSITDRRRRDQLVVQGSVAVGPDALLQDLDDANLSPSEASASLPDPGGAVTTTAQLDPIELLEDERTYRDRVRLMMRDLMLDDVHDANGNTLYQLNFDLTMVPSGDRSDPAIAAFEIDRVEPASFSEEQLATAFRRAIDQIESEVQSQRREIVRSLHQRSPSETRDAVAWEAGRALQQQAMAERANLDDLRRFAAMGDVELSKSTDMIHGLTTAEAASPRIALAKMVRESESALAQTESVLTEVESWRSPEADAGVAKTLSSAAQRALEHAYLQFGSGTYPPWIQFETPTSGALPNPRPLDGDEQLQSFKNAVMDEIRGAELEPGGVVLMDSPTEYAQNHSDVSALSDLLQLSLKASVTAPRLRFVFVSAVSASAWVRPRRSGTVTLGDDVGQPKSRTVEKLASNPRRIYAAKLFMNSTPGYEYSNPWLRTLWRAVAGPGSIEARPNAPS